MSPLWWVMGAAAAGALLGPSLRALVFNHAVATEDSWRRDCPECGARLIRDGWRTALARLPVSGRCPTCGVRIGPPIGTVELVAAALLAVIASRGGPGPVLVATWFAAVLGAALALIDMRVHRLPHRLTTAALAGTALLLVVAALADGAYARLGWAFAAAGGTAAAYLLLVLLYPGGMGMGDARLAPTIGLLTGWYGWRAALLAAAAGFLLAGFAAVALLLTRRVGRHDTLAYGPFMLLGALLVLAAR